MLKHSIFVLLPPPPPSSVLLVPYWRRTGASLILRSLCVFLLIFGLFCFCRKCCKTVRNCLQFVVTAIFGEKTSTVSSHFVKAFSYGSFDTRSFHVHFWIKMVDRTSRHYFLLQKFSFKRVLAPSGGNHRECTWNKQWLLIYYNKCSY